MATTEQEVLQQEQRLAEAKRALDLDAVDDIYADEGAIRAVINSTTDAFNRHDPRAWLRLATADAELITARGETMNGAAEIEQGLTALFQGRNRNAGVKTLDIRLRLIRQDVALVQVTNEISGVLGASGQTLPSSRELSLRILVKDQGVWRIDGVTQHGGSTIIASVRARRAGASHSRASTSSSCESLMRPKRRASAHAPHDYGKRWSLRRRGACPFGLVFTIAGDRTTVPFPRWSYRPRYLPDDLSLELAADTPIEEPEFCFGPGEAVPYEQHAAVNVGLLPIPAAWFLDQPLGLGPAS